WMPPRRRHMAHHHMTHAIYAGWHTYAFKSANAHLAVFDGAASTVESALRCKDSLLPLRNHLGQIHGQAGPHRGRQRYFPEIHTFSVRRLSLFQVSDQCRKVFGQRLIIEIRLANRTMNDTGLV